MYYFNLKNMFLTVIGISKDTSFNLKCNDPNYNNLHLMLSLFKNLCLQ
jgi:hypothetical protein